MPKTLETALKEPFATPVYYFASTETPLLREAAGRVKQALSGAGEADFTRVDGPAPDIGEVIAAAGSISFFGTPRVVEIREISPQAMSDKDAEELAALFGQLENAVLVVTCLYKDKRVQTGKKAKMLLKAAQQEGCGTEMAKPTRKENLDWINRQAEMEQAAFAPGAAQVFLDRAGEDRVLLKTEVQKLAAISGYGTITSELVERYGVWNVEADVFALARFITSGNAPAAFERLQELFDRRHEPIAISAALAGTFTDMLRVRIGTESRHAVGEVFTDMGYTGSEWRLQKAKENSARYTTASLQKCIICLAELDRQLKSSALPDKTILLEAAVGEIIRLGGRR